MPAAHFREGLKAMGLQDMTETEFEVIENHYIDPNEPGACEWTKFLHDVEFGEIHFFYRSILYKPCSKRIVNFTHIKLDIVIILGQISVEQI